MREKSSSVKVKVHAYHTLMLLLTMGVIGVFVARDLFLFYVMWEVMLIPMYFIIGIWGGERRIYASIKFFIFTMAGSLLMLVAIVYLGWQAGMGSGRADFSYEAILALPAFSTAARRTSRSTRAGSNRTAAVSVARFTFASTTPSILRR